MFYLLNDNTLIFYYSKIFNKPSILCFPQEYTIYSLQGSGTAYFLQEINLYIPSQNS